MFNLFTPSMTFVSIVLSIASYITAFAFWVSDYNSEYSFELGILGAVFSVPLIVTFAKNIAEELRSPYIFSQFLHVLAIIPYLFPFSITALVLQLLYFMVVAVVFYKYFENKMSVKF